MAYTACTAMRTTVAGQIQSIEAIARPDINVVVATATMNAGISSSPASPVTDEKGVDAWRSCAIRPARTTFQTRRTSVNARCAGASHCLTVLPG